MYYTTSTEEEYLILLLKHTKDIFYSVFNQEIEQYSFGAKFNYAQEVYNNKNNSFGYNTSIDFKYILFALEGGIHLTQLNDCLNQDDKQLFKRLFLKSKQFRNILWHSKTMSKNRTEKLIAIWKRVYPIIKTVYNDIDSFGQMKVLLFVLDKQLNKAKSAEENKEIINKSIMKDIESNKQQENNCITEVIDSKKEEKY